LPEWLISLGNLAKAQNISLDIFSGTPSIRYTDVGFKTQVAADAFGASPLDQTSSLCLHRARARR
jgi:hypothetical protein